MTFVCLSSVVSNHVRERAPKKMKGSAISMVLQWELKEIAIKIELKHLISLEMFEKLLNFVIIR
jgi:hypothetical protein